MPQFVRFMGDNGLPAWGEVERSDAAGRASGGLLAELPPEHDPSYYPSLMRALEDGGGGDPFQAEPGMILPPVSRPPVVLAIGMNYQDHLDEVNAKNEEDGKPTMPQPTEPTVFVKFPASVVGHEDAIVLPHMAPSCVDYEAELAVVIGRKVVNASPANALDSVAYYTCAHDVSARDAQLEGPSGQWSRGKSFDSFCPIGPYAAVGIDPNSLDIAFVLNGEAVQSSNTQNLIFDVPTLISYLSHSMTLLPGTVILTGTPGGVGAFKDPPRYLRPGDMCQVTIEGIGTLRNEVAADDYTGYTPTSQFKGSPPPPAPAPASSPVQDDPDLDMETDFDLDLDPDEEDL